MMSTNSPSLTSDFLADIKTQTSNSHKKLESLPLSGSIVSPEMKLEDYSRYLSLMHDVHQSVEETVFPILSAIIDDLKERKKTHLIEEDLLYLNYKKSDSHDVFNKPELTVPFALGILYVVEGSTLGGRFILKNVSTNAALSNEKGVSYFTGYGNQTGSYWKNFLNVLQEYQQTHNCGTTIIEGAIYAFDSIYNHFQSAEKE